MTQEVQPVFPSSGAEAAERHDAAEETSGHSASAGGAAISDATPHLGAEDATKSSSEDSGSADVIPIRPQVEPGPCSSVTPNCRFREENKFLCKKCDQLFASDIKNLKDIQIGS